MLSIPKLLILCAVVLAVWAFYEGMRARERALLTGRRYCREFGLQLLDETVASERLSLSRDNRGYWRIWRSFRFEYTQDGSCRQAGRIVLLGGRVQQLELEDQTILH